MADTLCRSCRDLARRQIRLLHELNQAPAACLRTSPLAMARTSRRQFHQTTLRYKEKPKPTSEPSGFQKALTGLATALLPAKAVQPYQIFGATENMYKACSSPATYKIAEELRKKEDVPMSEDGQEIGVGGGVWHDDFGLLPTFSTWSQVTMLHLYLLVVRLRCLEKDAWQAWQTQLVNHFFLHAEEMMEINHGMTSRMVRQKHLQNLFETWRGVILSYDEGLVKGDAVMAAAVWRNIFTSREDVDMRHVAAIVSWMRLVLRNLDRTLDPALLYHGANIFKVQPAAELKVVDEPVPNAVSGTESSQEKSGTEPSRFR